MQERMYAITTDAGYYSYFSFDTFLRNINEESDFRDNYPQLRKVLCYNPTCFEAVARTLELDKMEMFYIEEQTSENS